MKKQYEDELNKSLIMLEEINKSSIIELALKTTLPNSNDGTTYSSWLEGSIQFAEDNHNLIMEWIN